MLGFKGSERDLLMSYETAISVHDISKSYQIYSKPHHRLMQMLTRGRKTYFQEFFALRNISLKINKGETVGIVGANGGGKSTLLQLICGTLNPTFGNIEVNGRIAALLELGAGFNTEFTGKENIYLYASVLGLQKSEIDKRYRAIIEFADIGDFILQPIKTYSTGMVVRLAFAVAINIEPEILIIDEALAVGDELFQRKCFSKIESIKASGGTILFVSHSASAIVELCTRAILLDHGELLASGNPKNIIDAYHKLLYSPPEQRNLIQQEIRSNFNGALSVLGEIQPSPPNIASSELIETFNPNLVPHSTMEYEERGARVSGPKVSTLEGLQVNNLIRGGTYKYSFQAKFYNDSANVRFGMLIKTTSGYELGGSVTHIGGSNSIPSVRAGDSMLVEFTFKCNLVTGTYFLNAGILGQSGDEEIFLHRVIDAQAFAVQAEEKNLVTGVVDFMIESAVINLN